MARALSLFLLTVLKLHWYTKQVLKTSHNGSGRQWEHTNVFQYTFFVKRQKMYNIHRVMHKRHTGLPKIIFLYIENCWSREKFTWQPLSSRLERVSLFTTHVSMYLPIMRVVATFLKEGGLSRATAWEPFLCLVNVVDSHSLTTASLTELSGSVTTDPSDSLGKWRTYELLELFPLPTGSSWEFSNILHSTPSFLSLARIYTLHTTHWSGCGSEREYASVSERGAW